MAKKKKTDTAMPASPAAEKQPTQTRLELPADQLAEVRSVAKSIGLSLATFVRLAVLEKVKRIKEGKG